MTRRKDTNKTKQQGTAIVDRPSESQWQPRTPDQKQAFRNSALLHWAYDADDNQVLHTLQEGADVNTADPVTGLTALHIAVGTNNLPLAKALIENWNAEFTSDNRNRWPSYIAAECQVSDELADYIFEKENAVLGNSDG